MENPMKMEHVNDCYGKMYLYKDMWLLWKMSMIASRKDASSSKLTQLWYALV
jgi:hypothetical protein